ELSAEGEKGRDEMTLEAVKLALAQGEDEEGVIYLNVDGYERAFVFRTTFARGGDPTTPRQDLRPAIRLKADKYIRANPKYLLNLEVDNPPEGATLEVAIGQRIGGEFVTKVPAKVLADGKRRRVGFSPQSPDGGLVFEGSIQ